MLDPRESAPPTTGPPWTTDAVRVVSNRLVASSSIWASSDSHPSLPTWPTLPVGGFQPPQTGTGSESNPVAASTTPVELARSVLAQPGLVAGHSLSDSAQPTVDVSDELKSPAAGANASQASGSATNSRATQPLTSAPLNGDPRVLSPVPQFSGLGSVTGPSIAMSSDPLIDPPVTPNDAHTVRVDGQHVGGSASAVGSGGVFTLDSSPSNPGVVDPGSESPTVQGRIPSAMSNLAMASASSGSLEDSTMGRNNGSFFSTNQDVSGTNSIGATAGGNGSTMDLSKTNELLQQLIDAVRKQKTEGGTSLPNGGSSVYAERL